MRADSPLTKMTREVDGMKKSIIAGLSVVFSLATAQATVVDIDLSGNMTRGPTAGMLPGVAGKTTDVEWNFVNNKTLFSNLKDEDGNITGASFQITGESSVYFASTTSVAGYDFFETYANLGGAGEPGPASTNSFTISGLTNAADLYFYSTWQWIDAGAEFRVSSDAGATWSEWKLADGVPSVENAEFIEGQSYTVFSNITAHTDGTILGEWTSTTNGNSIANRAIFNAVQIVGTFDAPIAPAFITNSFNKGTVEANDPYSGTLADMANLSSFNFTNLTAGTWLNIAANGTMSGTPTDSDVGTNVFSVMVFDDLGNSDTATMYIEVTPDIIYRRYIDTYDNDGLVTNNGTGGGMMTFIPQASKAIYFVDDGNLTGVVTAPTDGASRGTVYTDNQFQLTQGFTLDVVYTVDVIETAVADTASFGLVDEVGNLDGLFVDASKGISGLGMSLTTRGGVAKDAQGLIEMDVDGIAYTNLSNAQVISTGTDQTFQLTVFEDGSYSYSINGAAATTGTTALDLTKDYHFAAYTQRNAGFAIQSVSLIALNNITEIGDITIELGSGTEASFSWYGEPYAEYELQARENLAIGGEEAWIAITNVVGEGAVITIEEDMDKPAEFYRVKLVD
jgi:hypothetical protein